MTVEFFPSLASGTVKAPPSKSMAHRALIASALAEGRTVVDNLAPSEDLLATVDCLRALGAKVVLSEKAAVVVGMDPGHVPSCAVLPCRASGSTLRFLIPLVLTTGKEITFTGSPVLFSRPLSVYEDICRAQGLRFAREHDRLTVQGRLKAGKYLVPGDVSSQFISGLSFALPLLDGDSEIEIIAPVESRPYIDMTFQTLRDFGVRVTPQDNRLFVPGRQRYISPGRVLMEGDWSNAAFLDAFNLLGGAVEITGLRDDTIQGDRVYPAYFEALRSDAPVLDLADHPDLGPICFALAAALHGAAFCGVRRLRLKESDRIDAMAEELAKLGVTLSASEDSVTVHASDIHAPALPLCGHNDHRIVMALSVLAARTGGTISCAQAVNKSFPGFFDTLSQLGVSFELKP